MNDQAEIRKLLGSWLRQSSGGTLPAAVPMTPALEQIADQATAQKVWTELLSTGPARKKNDMGMTEASLAELTRQIMEQGYDLATACHFAALIGDTPIKNEQGNIIVRDEHGHELAQLQPLDMFSEF